MKLSEFRQQYPQYDDMSDDALASALHEKYYSDMDYGAFTQQIGMSQPDPSMVDKAAGIGGQVMEALTAPSTQEMLAGEAPIPDLPAAGPSATDLGMLSPELNQPGPTVARQNMEELLALPERKELDPLGGAVEAFPAQMARLMTNAELMARERGVQMTTPETVDLNALLDPGYSQEDADRDSALRDAEVQMALEADPKVREAWGRLGAIEDDLRAIRDKAAKGSSEAEFVYDVFSVLGDQAPAYLLGAVTRSPQVTTSLIGGQAMTGQYPRRRAAGEGISDAAMGSYYSGIVEYVTEKLPVGILFKQGTPFVKRVLEATLGEGVQEAGTSVLQSLYDKATISPDKTLGQIIQEAKDEGLIGAAAGAVLGGGAGVAHGIASGEAPIMTKGQELNKEIQDVLSALTPEMAEQQAAGQFFGAPPVRQPDEVAPGERVPESQLGRPAVEEIEKTRIDAMIEEEKKRNEADAAARQQAQEQRAKEAEMDAAFQQREAEAAAQRERDRVEAEMQRAQEEIEQQTALEQNQPDMGQTQMQQAFEKAIDDAVLAREGRVRETVTKREREAGFQGAEAQLAQQRTAEEVAAEEAKLRQDIETAVPEQPQTAMQQAFADVISPETDQMARPITDETGDVELVHFTQQQGLTELDPAKHGAGIKGAESQRKLQDPENWQDRSYFGVTGSYKKEAGLGANEYRVKVPLNQLYDFVEDPDELKDKARGEDGRLSITAYEKAVREAGYKGYWVDDPGMGQVVAMFEKTPVTQYEGEPTLPGQAATPTTPAAPGAIPMKQGSELTRKYNTYGDYPLTQELEKNGGFTIDPETGGVPAEGYAVGIGREKVFDGKVTEKDIAEYRKANQDALSQPDHFLGGWVDEGKTYLDVSRVHPGTEQGLQAALEQGRTNNEIGIMNLGVAPEEGYIPIDYDVTETAEAQNYPGWMRASVAISDKLTWLAPATKMADNVAPLMRVGGDAVTVGALKSTKFPVQELRAKEKAAVGRALSDLESAGFPLRAATASLRVMYSHPTKNSKAQGQHTQFYLKDGNHSVITLHDSVLASVIENAKSEAHRGFLAELVSHEIGHAVDVGDRLAAGYERKHASVSSPMFDINNGEIAAELIDVHVLNYLGLGEYFNYPLGKLLAYSTTFDPEIRRDYEEFFAKELFAQLFSLYYTRATTKEGKKALRAVMPKSVAFMEKIDEALRNNPDSTTARDSAVRAAFRSDTPGDIEIPPGESAVDQAAERPAVEQAGPRDRGGEQAETRGRPDQLGEGLLEPDVDSIDRPERDYKALNRKIREQDRTAWSKAKKWLKRQLTPEGLLPASVFKAMLQRDFKFNTIEFDVRTLIRKLEMATKKDYKKGADRLDEEVQRLLTSVMQGTSLAEVPEATKTALLAMRQYIDSLSIQYLGVLRDEIAQMMETATTNRDAEIIKARAALLQIIAGNVGQYLHRSYRAFDDPKWAKEVPDQVLNDARQYLIERYVEQGETQEDAERLTETTINEILKNGTAYENTETFIKESKLGAKDLSVLQRRKDIAPEIRALLGEYTDPRINFAKSATKMGRLIWNQKFLNRVRELGMGDFLFEGIDRPPEATSQIAAERSDVYAPLNGLWTTPEINRAFKDALGKEQMAAWYRTIVQFNGLVKFGKTVLSPTTAMRNWMSAFFFTVANGHYNLAHAKKSLSGFFQYFGRATNDERIAYLRRLQELGVVYDTPYAGEMMRLLADTEIMDKLMFGEQELKIKHVLDIATKFYQYGDDFWKIIGFENEKGMWQREGLSEAEAEKKAAERVRATYPTYSLVPKAIKSLRRFPLAGTFVSFPAEIIRTTGNMIRLTAEDVKAGRMEMAARRAVGLAIAGSFAHALQQLSMSWLGYDDDDDEAVRMMAAPWQKNSNLIYTGRDEEGHIRYLDLSFLDPYNYWKRPIMAIMRDQPWEDKMKSAASDAFSPFFGEDIAAGAIFDVLSNKKDSGAPVYKEHAELPDQLIDSANHIRKAVQPGIVSNVERTLKALEGEVSPSGRKYDIEDEMAAWVGFRMSTLDPLTALFYRAYDFGDAKADARKILRDKVRDYRGSDIGDVEGAFEKAQRVHNRAYEDLTKLVLAAEKTGISRQEIHKRLKNSGLSVSDAGAVIRDKIPPMTISPQTMQKDLRAIKDQYGQEAVDELRNRYRRVMQMAREQD